MNCNWRTRPKRVRVRVIVPSDLTASLACENSKEWKFSSAHAEQVAPGTFPNANSIHSSRHSALMDAQPQCQKGRGAQS